ncbi:hypothetical protein BS47DRAFT_1400992 [Hydnum rufescens UP504]|uniref:Uncharacterized protein n=1 Tax=Hydnum rufescens UP504 TaxID=1448309 RepID=A0A9P6DN58_9AGAM|nr:hypothetical protein BS47DRAFT_1400992 [Hydnum rufescens UP504]
MHPFESPCYLSIPEHSLESLCYPSIPEPFSQIPCFLSTLTILFKLLSTLTTLFKLLLTPQLRHSQSATFESSQFLRRFLSPLNSCDVFRVPLNSCNVFESLSIPAMFFESLFDSRNFISVSLDFLDFCQVISPPGQNPFNLSPSPSIFPYHLLSRPVKNFEL